MTITSSQISASARSNVTAQNPWAAVLVRLKPLGCWLTPAMQDGSRWATNPSFRLKIVEQDGKLTFFAIPVGEPSQELEQEVQMIGMLIKQVYEEFHVRDVSSRILAHLSVVSFPVSHLELMAMFGDRYLDRAIQSLRDKGWLKVGAGLGVNPTYELARGAA